MKIKHTKTTIIKNTSMNIFKNVQILYFIFFVSILNVLWLLYKNDQNSIIIFASCCLVLYLINKNMIFVLGLSLIIVNIYSLVKTKEGFEEKKEDIDSDIENDNQSMNLHSMDEPLEKEGYTDNEDSMQDKTIMKNIKQLDPLIFNTIKNLNSVDIDKINKTINELTNKVKDP
jgi:hypothetical protein